MTDGHQYDARFFDYTDRAALRSAGVIVPWYAYNAILSVNDGAAASLPDAVRASRVPAGTAIANVAPFGCRRRAALLRPPPVSLVSRLSVWHRRWLARA